MERTEDAEQSRYVYCFARLFCSTYPRPKFIVFSDGPKLKKLKAIPGKFNLPAHMQTQVILCS